jgi:hypothetical protein
MKFFQAQNQNKNINVYCFHALLIFNYVAIDKYFFPSEALFSCLANEGIDVDHLQVPFMWSNVTVSCHAYK